MVPSQIACPLRPAIAAFTAFTVPWVLEQSRSTAVRRIAPAEQPHVDTRGDGLAQQPAKFRRMHRRHTGFQRGGRTVGGIGVRTVDLVGGHAGQPSEE